jgi:hypothetical protein
MPKTKSINPKKYRPKNDVLYNPFIKPAFESPGEALATINAPPQSASSFKASVHAPKHVYHVCLTCLVNDLRQKIKTIQMPAAKAIVLTYLPMEMINPVIKRNPPARYTRNDSCAVCSGGRGKITGLNPG